MTVPCPQVYRAIGRIAAAFARDGIAKTHVNLVEQYQYRSIDDVMARLSPLLARHRLCVLPRVLVREAEDRVGEMDTLLVNVRLLVAFDLVSARDGSRHTVQAWGEALDRGDKGTAKAMSSAFKCAMLETFCIPVTSEDADRTGFRLKTPCSSTLPPVDVPDEGWPLWAERLGGEITAIVDAPALHGLRAAHGDLLGRLRRERPDLYQAIGQAFAMQAGQLSVGDTPVQPSPAPSDGAFREQMLRIDPTATDPSTELTDA